MFLTLKCLLVCSLSVNLVYVFEEHGLIARTPFVLFLKHFYHEHVCLSGNSKSKSV